MSELVVCLGCKRHVRIGDPICPFCGGTARGARPPQRAVAGLGRAALMAFGATVASCGPAESTAVETSPPTQPVQAQPVQPVQAQPVQAQPVEVMQPMQPVEATPPTEPVEPEPAEPEPTEEADATDEPRERTRRRARPDPGVPVPAYGGAPTAAYGGSPDFDRGL